MLGQPICNWKRKMKEPPKYGLNKAVLGAYAKTLETGLEVAFVDPPLSDIKRVLKDYQKGPTGEQVSHNQNPVLKWSTQNHAINQEGGLCLAGTAPYKPSSTQLKSTRSANPIQPAFVRTRRMTRDPRSHSWLRSASARGGPPRAIGLAGDLARGNKFANLGMGLQKTLFSQPY